MKRFFLSFGYAWNGLKTAVAEQRNLKFHLTVALLAVIAGFYFNVTSGEWLAIIVTIALVIVTELINTAIENAVDLVSPQKNPLAGKIKDIAAAAVLVSAFASVATGIIVFAKYVIN